MKPERLGDMLIFAKVVEQGSFTLAADLLELSKSAVSKAVSRLESYLGLRLLQRTTRSMVVTLEGQAYYEYCQQIVTQAAAAEAHLGSFRDSPRGMVRITAAVTFGSVQVAPLLARLLKLYPELELELLLDDGQVDLIAEKVDIAVRCGPLPSSGLIARKVSDLPYSVVCSAGYLAGRELPLHPYQLASHQCLWHGACAEKARWHFIEHGKPIVVPVNGRLRVNSSQALIHAMKQDLGIALLPRYQVAAELEAGNLVELLQDFMPPAAPVYLVYAHRQHMSAAVKTCIRFLQEQL
ncbi:DNA-binding transcriptional LysR family regulator [Rheinheimera pacifica]|uniref:LysR family transcriptional regulator n=1 Tax=Rheinheimera pacifica TaxID=173990 RepID=UPI002860F2C3|nr:LysR family transcriptional regulator [Rheinheimera pacifica]MDR6983862.1 DNA-binding transcriptional LysR family regulator [Rheinheimera pacifica]